MEGRRMLSLLMIIGIVGYFTVPSVAGYIVNAGGGGALGQKVTSMMSSTTTGALSRTGQAADNILGMKGYGNEGYSGGASGSGSAGAVGRSIGGAGAYMADKLSGDQKKS